MKIVSRLLVSGALASGLVLSACFPTGNPSAEALRKATLTPNVGIEGQAILAETSLGDFVGAFGAENFEFITSGGAFVFAPAYFSKELKFFFPATTDCQAALSGVAAEAVNESFATGKGRDEFFAAYPACANARLQRIAAQGRLGQFQGQTETGIALGDSEVDVNGKDPALRSMAAMSGDEEIAAIEARMPRSMLEKPGISVWLTAAGLRKEQKGGDTFRLSVEEIVLPSNRGADYFRAPPVPATTP